MERGTCTRFKFRCGPWKGDKALFTYPTFDVQISRDLDLGALGWPAPGAAVDGRGLGCNREYMDLRRQPWTEAERVFALESSLLGRIERAEGPVEELVRIEDELYEADGDHLFGLDIGVAAVVVCLSAAGCVPFTSCNAGAFGGCHHEEYPLVGFFAKPKAALIVITAAHEADIGLEHSAEGGIIAFANDIRCMRRFAQLLLNNASAFNAINHRPSPGQEPSDGTE